MSDDPIGVDDTQLSDQPSTQVPQTESDLGARPVGDSQRRAFARARIAQRLFEHPTEASDARLRARLDHKTLRPEDLPWVEATNYAIIDELGRGGLGRIMRARDTRTGRTVAIKEMLTTSEDAAARFVREAMVTANLQHPCIVPVYELGRWPSGQPFYAMKLVHGQPLDAAVARTASLDARLALVTHVAAIADALAYAHGERVIHRDLKPQNVICGAHGETVVIDWGLARPLDEGDSAAMPRLAEAPDGFTHVGTVMGTPCYMPPEQARGERVDEKADVYAIGAILYHVLAGVPPYAGHKGVVELVVAGPPRALHELAPRAPADLVAIVERAMAREPAARYPSAAELAIDLRRFMNGQLVRAHAYTRRERVRRFIARHRAAVAVAAVACAALVVADVVWMRALIGAKRVAIEEGERADGERAEAQRRLVSQYVDRARVELGQQHPDRALAYAVAAAEQAPPDATTRFVIARALDALPPLRRVALSAELLAVSFVPNSHDLIVADAAGISRWEPQHDRRRWRLAGEVGEVTTTADGGMLVAVFADDIALVDHGTGAVATRMRKRAPGELLGLVGWDERKRWLAAPSAGGAIDVFDLAARQLVATVPAPGVTEARFVSADGERLVVETPDAVSGPLAKKLAIVDRTGRELAALCRNCGELRAVGAELAFSAQSPVDGKVRVGFVDWSGTPRLDLALETTSTVLHLDADRARDRFALAMVDGGLEVRRLTTGNILWRLRLADRAYQAKFDAAGRLWVLGSYGGVTVYDAASGVELDHWAMGGATLVLSGDGARVAVGTISPPGVVTWPIPPPSAVAIAPTAVRVRKLALGTGDAFATGGDDGKLELTADGRTRRLADLGARISSLHFLDERTVLAALPDRTLLLATADGAVVATLGAGLRAEPSPDRATIATGGEDGAVILWDRATASRLRELGTLPRRIMDLTWSTDGGTLAAIDQAGEVRVWKRDGTLVRHLKAAKRGVEVTLSHDGRWLARSCDGDAYKLYSLTGAADRDVAVPPRQRYTAEFSPDGAHLLVAGSGFVALTDTATGRPITMIRPSTDITSATFSPDRTAIYGGGIDRRVRVWDARTGTEIASRRAPGEVYGLIPARDGSRLAVLTDGAALMWRTTNFEGDAASLRALATCRAEYEVDGGVLRARAIDVAACNRE